VKPLTAAIAVAVPTLLLLADVLDFTGGRAGHDIDAPFYILPASVVAFLLALALSCVLGTLAVIHLLRRHFRRAASLLVILLGSLALIPLFWPHSPFILGFRNRLQHHSSVAEIEAVSQRCLALMPQGGIIYDPEKVLGALPLLHYIREVDVTPPDVCFTWGGPLSGHWGIYVLGSATSIFPTHFGRTLRFSDHILLFRGE
jgi:hypothetical protein